MTDKKLDEMGLLPDELMQFVWDECSRLYHPKTNPDGMTQAAFQEMVNDKAKQIRQCGRRIRDDSDVI